MKLKKPERKTWILMIIAVILGVLLFMTSDEPAEYLKDYYLAREQAGGETIEYSLSAVTGEMRVNDILVEVEPKAYSERELQMLSGKAQAELMTIILGHNESFQNVTEDLVFPAKLEGYPFRITLSDINTEYIGDDGEILYPKGFDTKLKAVLTCGDFTYDFCIDVHVSPGLEVRRRILKNKIETSISARNDTACDNVILPGEIDGENLSYEIPGTKKNPMMLIAGLVVAGLFYAADIKDYLKTEEERKKKILSEYPILLQKMMMYLSSGMTIRNIFVRISDEADSKGEDNPLYDEMRISVNEFGMGISENSVYTDFGERTKVPDIVRFTALLSQNLKKGSSKLGELLKTESDQAFGARKERAIKAGEQAGTKLLVPMMLILIDVMIIIMVPAFRSM